MCTMINPETSTSLSNKYTNKQRFSEIDQAFTYYSSDTTQGSTYDLTMDNPDELVNDWIPANVERQPEGNHCSPKVNEPSANGVQDELQILDALFTTESDNATNVDTSTNNMMQPIQHHQLVPAPAAYTQTQYHTWPVKMTPNLHPQYSIVQHVPYENVFHQRNVMVQQLKTPFASTPPTDVRTLPETVVSTNESRLKRRYTSESISEASESENPIVTRSGRAIKRNKFVNQQELQQLHQSDDSYLKTAYSNEAEDAHDTNILTGNGEDESNSKVRNKVSEKIKSLKLYASPTPKKTGLTSRFRGVCWYKRTNKWVVQIKVKGKRKHIGYFSNEEEAAAAYDNALKDLIKTQQKELEDQAKTTSNVRIPRRRIFNNLPTDF